MEEKKKTERAVDIVQLVAPGTPIREGLENVLRANTGGLIVVGYNDKMKAIVDGGFQINCPFSPTYLYELAKMDGAIILNENGSKILIANAQLAPSPMIPSSETGMRHRTAERVARETDGLVIAISQRRNIITLYKGTFRYALREISVILAKANQAVQTLEKYRVVLDQSISHLTLLEFEEMVTFGDVLQVLHRCEMVLRIKNELFIYLYELGTEGRLVHLQMHELLADMEEEVTLIIRDYAKERQIKPFELLQRFQKMITSEVLEDSALLKLLGHSIYVPLEDAIEPRGYRVLNKIPRLPIAIIENLINEFSDLNQMVKASVNALDDVEGIGEVRARKIKDGLRFIKEQSIADNQL
ncbi:DNA integrity scanning diadenylate cyclase DisA [Jeotgalibacillus proteolyticus]|uniref:diadenylate cyclase n=1 Tax=Jeotgalibacillus proteolyticus TaxID=2082395 RepID=A0A2S5G6E8_9BACL|nr:DNA integrity scanning diadenylate cyclase DisA [Jeotgalibacillus proteolyticus]PPA68578.1 DNA integrity scanning protein DisA [Jeotgalibacillus proteolyticus]